MAKKSSITSIRMQSGTKGPVIYATPVHPTLVEQWGWDTSITHYTFKSASGEFDLGTDVIGQYALITSDSPRDADGELLGVGHASFHERLLHDAADAFSALIVSHRNARRNAV